MPKARVFQRTGDFLATFHFHQVVPVDVEKIKGVEDDFVRSALAPSAAQRLQERVEVRAALLIEDHSLAVEDGRHAQPSGCRFDRGEAIGPVMPALGQDPHAIRLDVDHHAVPVPFHFKLPLWAHGRPIDQDRNARLDTGRHGVKGKLRLGGIARLTALTAQRRGRLA